MQEVYAQPILKVSTKTYLKLMKYIGTHHHRFGIVMNMVPKLVKMEAPWFYHKSTHE